MNGHNRQFSSSTSINDPIYGAGQHAQIEPSSQTLLNGYRDTLQSSNEYGQPGTVGDIKATHIVTAVLKVRIGQAIEVKELGAPRIARPSVDAPADGNRDG